MEQRKETRYTPLDIRVLSDDNGVATRTIKGTAIVFNSQSQLLNERNIAFRETIKPEAITPELVAGSDIKMLYNHKADFGVLARSKWGVGTLQIEITPTGVDFRFEAPNSPLGNNILESVSRGDLDACSFAFKTAEGGEQWLKTGDVYQRTINKIGLLDDFSIVVNPAYTATNVNTRGLEELIEAENIDKEAVEKREIELATHYAELRKRFNIPTV